ncbi:hypothetical protein BLAHAN_06983 [Blautia hansenii DSM 20583]|uniref:Uncharacterized protein n=1 Tax=Blautia hansenii DSM 20583 TaxID=537007 RepID=C9LC25_BLAHA|nr:hypothetical protein BLAHAN_06983 [Blautia hansenii DSM 20583]
MLYKFSFCRPSEMTKTTPNYHVFCLKDDSITAIAGNNNLLYSRRLFKKWTVLPLSGFQNTVTISFIFLL